MQIKPILKAILLCDQTIIEERTRKRSLIGIFDRIKGPKFPFIHPAMSIYVQFREVEGTFQFALELVDLQTEKPVSRAYVKQFKVDERSRDCELAFSLFSIKFEHPGQYEFRVFINETIFGQKSFVVL